MEGWTQFDMCEPPAFALVIFYIPNARFVWGSGLDYKQIKEEYPAVTHWKVISREPDAN